MVCYSEDTDPMLSEGLHHTRFLLIGEATIADQAIVVPVADLATTRVVGQSEFVLVEVGLEQELVQATIASIQEPSAEVGLVDLQLLGEVAAADRDELVESKELDWRELLATVQATVQASVQVEPFLVAAE